MDYRKLNQYTVRDNNPLPNIQSALERLHGKRLFSKFDIRWGYNNIHIKEEDQYKAAFKTPEGTYIPRVMYFGLTNAPPFFQRTMHRDFRALLQKYPDNLGNYMDNWWIADIALSSAPEVTSSYVTTWVRVGVNRARALYDTVVSSVFHTFLSCSIEFWTMYSASFS